MTDEPRTDAFMEAFQRDRERTPFPTECPTCDFPVGYGYGLAGGGIGAYVYCRCEGCEKCHGRCDFFLKRPEGEDER